MATYRDSLPKDDKGTFPETNLPQLTPAEFSGTFKAADSFKLVQAGTGRPMIWKGDYWCHLGERHDNPIVFTKFETGGALYLASVDNPKESFLSVSHNQYVGLYGAAGRTGWTMHPHPKNSSAIEITSDYWNGQAIGTAGGYDTYLLAWGAATSIEWEIIYL